MSYNTMYSLRIRTKNPDGFTAELSDRISMALEDRGVVGYALEYRPDLVEENGRTMLWFSGMEPVTWYNCNTDMQEISTLFPDCVFRLHGDGEDQGDLWNAYFMNGDLEECMAEIVYPEPEKIPW